MNDLLALYGGFSCPVSGFVIDMIQRNGDDSNLKNVWRDETGNRRFQCWIREYEVKTLMRNTCRKRVPFHLRVSNDVGDFDIVKAFEIKTVKHYNSLEQLPKNEITESTLYIPSKSDSPAFDVVFYEKIGSVHHFYFISVSMAFLPSSKPLDYKSCGEFIHHFFEAPTITRCMSLSWPNSVDFRRTNIRVHFYMLTSTERFDDMTVQLPTEERGWEHITNFDPGFRGIKRRYSYLEF
jgi:hypothetical protein